MNSSPEYKIPFKINWGKNKSYNKTAMHVMLTDEFHTEEIALLTLDTTGRGQNIPEHHF